MNYPAIIAHDTIKAAQEHVRSAQMAGSGLLCLEDALSLFAKGEYHYAQRRALRSLAYSVGIASPLYLQHQREGLAIPRPE